MVTHAQFRFVMNCNTRPTPAAGETPSTVHLSDRGVKRIASAPSPASRITERDDEILPQQRQSHCFANLPGARDPWKNFSSVNTDRQVAPAASYSAMRTGSSPAITPAEGDAFHLRDRATLPLRG